MKRAFSLIEVVFAIVVISISLMSVPMLLKQSSKSDEYSIIQESILATSTKMGNILSYPWDGASYDTTNKVLRVLDVSSGDAKLDRDPTSLDGNYRRGHVAADKRRRFFDNNTPATGTGGISQFDGQTATIAGSGAYDYKDAGLNMVSKVYYIDDSEGSSVSSYDSKNITFNLSTTKVTTGSTNIKLIEIKTTSPLLNRSLTLRTFSCNIGQSSLLQRYYP